MPLQKLEFRPGVNREGTTLANEGGWFESDKVRFRSGYPEKIGGWTQDIGTAYSTDYTLGEALVPPTTGSFWGVCRSLWNWITLAGSNLLGVGTNLKFYIQNGPAGSFYDVTPLRSTTAAGDVTFTASTGSKTITVTDVAHGAQTGDFVMFSGAASLGGAITAAILNAEFRITYINNDQYSITTTTAATAGDSGNGGAAVIGRYQISVGSETYTAGVGWGAGGWGGALGPASTTALSGSLATVANTTLLGALTPTATTINVANGNALAASGSVLVDSEIISYTGRTATTLTGCVRGTAGSTAVAHNTATGVIQYSTVTINVTSSTSFSATYPGTISIGSELISYTGKGAGTFTGCIRGINGFVSAHSGGDTVAQYASTATGWGVASTSSTGGLQLRTWSQINFGQDLIMNPRGGALYYWPAGALASTFIRAYYMGPNSTVTTASGSFTTDSSCPSVCNIVNVSDGSRFVLAFGTNDLPSTKGGVAPTTQDPLLIRWSDQENPAIWYPEATNQAGSYRLSHGSTIVNTLQTRQEILVWTDTALYSMQYLGPPYVWGFQIMADNISIMSPNSAAVANNVTYWMGTDKFYMYSGRVETLPCTLRQYVYDDINLDQSYQAFASTNEGYNEIWFFYCSAGSDVVDKYVVFNHLERTWYYGTLSRTAWLDTPLRGQPLSTGYSAPVFTASISGTTMTVTNISSIAGGLSVGMEITGTGVTPNTTITAFGSGTGSTGTYTLSNSMTVASSTLVGVPINSCGVLINQETNNDDGTTDPASPITAFVQSSDFDIGDGHNFGFVYRIIPDVTFDGSTVNAPALDFTVRPRQFPGTDYGSSDAPAVTSTQNYTPPPVGQRTYNVQQFTEQVYVRIRGRQMAFRITSTGLGVAWQLGVPRMEVRPDGRR
jgi:hypothetical protein